MRFIAILQRDLTLGWRKKSHIFQPLVFQLLIVTLFPLGLGAGSQALQEISPAVIWILALLGTLITLEQIFKDDYDDGSMETYILSGYYLPQVVLAKSLAHWLLTGIPVILFAPIVGLLLHLPNHSYGILMLSLLLGTPIISLLGSVGSALIMNLKNGALLLSVLVMPLLAPVLIFGAGAVLESSLGNSAKGHILLLSGLLIMAVTLIPFATSAAIRTNLE